MILIADSGSTKTDWVLVNEGRISASCHTQGINPFHQSEEEIARILGGELLPQLLSVEQVSEVFFYGSGVRPEFFLPMEQLLRQAMPQAALVEARGDLLGAARALCGTGEGIACILGTGANSCLFDGRDIVANTPPLGYILGDEGSGAVLGIRFLNALYKRLIPDALITEFQEYTGLTMADVIARVYRQPLANRFLASLSPFICGHLSMPEVRRLVVGCFRDFLRRNVMPYRRPDLPVSAVGSVAYYYQEPLAEAIEAEGMKKGDFLKSPLPGLLAYHHSLA